MNQKIYRSILEPIRSDLTYDERWNADDKGLITCWEVGRSKRDRNSELVRRVENDELPILEWKGGVDKALKNNEKYGSYNYLAQWQGIRGEDLNIDLSAETTLKCSNAATVITYTADSKKYAQP